MRRTSPSNTQVYDSAWLARWARGWRVGVIATAITLATIEVSATIGSVTLGGRTSVAAVPEATPVAPTAAPLPGRQARADAVTRARELFRRALEEARAGRLDAARDLAIQGAELAPRDADGLNLLGETHEQLENVEAARQAYEAAAAADPQWLAPVQNLGRLHLSRRDYGAAIEPLQRATRLAPDDAMLFAWLGAAYKGVQQPSEARAAFDRAFALDPDSALLATDVADARLADGDLAGAIEAAERATALDPDNWLGFVMLGDLLLSSPDADDWVRAPAAYRRAAASRPSDPRLLLRLAQIYDQIGLATEQAATLRAAIDAGADDPQVWLTLGDTLHGLTRNAEAIEAFSRAIELDPELGRAFYLRGQAAFNMNRREEALADVQRAIDAMPGDPDPLLTMARFLIHRGDLDEAEGFIAQATAVAPGSSTADLLLGRVRLQQGRLDEAIPLLERAGTDEAQIEAFYLLGQALLQRGDQERGRQVMAGYQAMLNARRDTQVTSLRLGVMSRGRTYKLHARVFLAEGRIDKAREQLEASLELAPDDRETWELLATVYDRLAMPQEASRARERAAELSAAAR